MTVISAAFSRSLRLVLVIVVEQEADRAAIHAVDRNAAVEVAMHGLQHQAVAAQRHDGVGLGEVGIAVVLGELGERSAASLVSLATKAILSKRGMVLSRRLELA